ncbi:Hypothetical protein GLP15_1239 [Giardia lamblia P15]|uniref:Ankyrin repeat protein n=1 Tax=Giardia intestinalis (strain P15) TaxID=658858 RepID=E1EZS2_GIAIA|nr:Hypothetical protein GLP15_1239 [Giardia lamblia P15]
MALHYPTADNLQGLPSGKMELIATSSTPLTPSCVSRLAGSHVKNSFSRLRYFNGSFGTLRPRSAWVCSGNDYLLFTFLATLTSKDIHLHGITVPRELQQLTHTCCRLSTKVRGVVGDLSVAKYSRSKERGYEAVYYKLNNRSVEDEYSILTSQPDVQDANLMITTGSTVLRRGYQRSNQWVIKWPFLSWASGISGYMKPITRQRNAVVSAKHYIPRRKYGNKRTCEDESSTCSMVSHVCRLLGSSNYGVCGILTQRHSGFCHRFLTASSMKRSLRKGCSNLNGDAIMAQSKSMSCDDSLTLMYTLTSLRSNDVGEFSQNSTVVADQPQSSVRYCSKERTDVAKLGAVYGRHCGVDTIGMHGDSITGNASYSTASDDVAVCLTPIVTINHENSHITEADASCNWLALFQTSCQLKSGAMVIESPQLSEVTESTSQESALNVLQFKLFTERPLSEVFQLDTISANMGFLVQYLFHRPSSFFLEARKSSTSLVSAVKTFLEDLGGNEDLCNALTVVAHSTSEPQLDALETLLMYTHEDNYILSDLRSILIRLLAEQCWKSLSAKGYSRCYCNALRGIVPTEVDSGEWETETETDGWTPWFRYVEQGNYPAVQCLIKRCKGSHLSVFISAMEYGPWLPTAMMMTVVLRNARLFDILSSVETRLQDKCLGYTALMIAVLLGWNHAVEALAHSKIIACKAENGEKVGPHATVQQSEVGMQDVMGKTALVCAVETNRATYIDMLISEAGLTNGVGTPAIAYAMDPAKLNIFKKLLPLECNCKDSVGNSILYYANKAKIKHFSQLVLDALNSSKYKAE